MISGYKMLLKRSTLKMSAANETQNPISKSISVKRCGIPADCDRQACSYLLRARWGAFDGGPFQVATLALGVHIKDCQTGSAAASTPEPNRNLRYPLQNQGMRATSGFTPQKNDQSFTSFKVLALPSPLCSWFPTDKTENRARDINHSMTHLTQTPFLYRASHNQA